MVAASSRSASRNASGGSGGASGAASNKVGASSSSAAANSRTTVLQLSTGGGGSAKNDTNKSQQQQQLQMQSKLMLARGYTSRLLPPSGALRPLSSEEIDKDLRHFQAYHRAAVTYRQQYYLAVNPNLVLPSSAGGVGGGGPQPSAVPGGGVPSSPYLLHHPHPGGLGIGGGLVAASLPVRIDPEEEKRLALLRRKIARAEYMREDLEQRYVSLRAHYVQRSQEVLQLRENVVARQDFLRSCVRERAAMLGLMRSRLQITRDALAALQRRGRVLEQQAQLSAAGGSDVASQPPAADADVNMDDATTSTKPALAAPGAETAASAATVTGSEPLTLEDVWNQVDEELKKQQRKLVSGGSTGGGTKGTSKAIVWPCTKMPPTPHGVPLLLSNVSTAPEKSVAFYANGIFGSDRRCSLAWMLPETIPAPDDGHDGDHDDDRAGSPAPGGAAASSTRRQRELDGLREEVAFLQAELERERRQSQQISETVARARSKNDEWVAMICLVRQETESVLHRHNVVLESDVARLAAERLYQDEQDARNQRKLQDEADAAEAAAAVANASDAGRAASSYPGADGPGVGVMEVDVPVESAGAEEGDDGAPDEENDGDDEGSEEEEQPDGEDRGAEEEGERGIEEEPPKGNHNKRSAQVDAGADVEDSRKKRRKV